MNRQIQLLEKAAKAMEKGEDPFHRVFLVKNRVTIDEAHDMAEQLAIGARLFIRVRQEMVEGGLAGQVGAYRLASALMEGKQSS